MKKEDALEKMWAELEANPVPEDISARKAKFASLMAGDAPGAVRGAAGARRGFGRVALRYAWAPLAAAACIAAVLLLRTPAQPAPDLIAEVAPAAESAQPAPGLLADGSPVEVVPKNGLNSEQNPVSPSASTPAEPMEPAPRPAPAPAASLAPESTPDLHTTHTEAGPDPWKMMEEEDRREAAKASVKSRPSIAFFGALGAGGALKGNALTSLASNINNGSVPGELPGASQPGLSYFSGDTPPAGKPAVHDLPLNFGLSLRAPLAGRLSVETGLTYSYLRSSERQLHYLDLPLSLQFDLIRGKHTNVYVSGGGSLAYCVTGGGKEHPWQPSVSVTAGAEYKFAGRVSLFGEGSFNHYFDDRSPLETYYSLNPDTPTFKLGLRFSILR